MNDHWKSSRLAPFFIVGSTWFILSAGLCFFFSQGILEFLWAFLWFLALWALSMFDFYSIVRTTGAVFSLMGAPTDQRAPHMVPVVYWGLMKVVCLAFFGWILLMSESIPQLSLLAGTGTLIAVPVFGGFIWSQKELRHA